MIRYACDYCGYQGSDAAARLAEEVQCQMCGEPVMPWPEEADDKW